MTDYTIVVDTREQKPLWNSGIISKHLETGDYSLEMNGVSHENKFAIERKSLMDLFGTLGKGHKRFTKELERASKLDYFAIVVDGSYSSIVNKNFPNSYRSTMKGFVIAKILFTIHMKYQIPIFMTQGRIESKQVIKSIMNSYIKIMSSI